MKTSELVIVNGLIKYKDTIVRGLLHSRSTAMAIKQKFNIMELLQWL